MTFDLSNCGIKELCLPLNTCSMDYTLHTHIDLSVFYSSLIFMIYQIVHIQPRKYRLPLPAKYPWLLPNNFFLFSCISCINPPSSSRFALSVISAVSSAFTCSRSSQYCGLCLRINSWISCIESHHRLLRYSGYIGRYLGKYNSTHVSY